MPPRTRSRRRCWRRCGCGPSIRRATRARGWRRSRPGGSSTPTAARSPVTAARRRRTRSRGPPPPRATTPSSCSSVCQDFVGRRRSALLVLASKSSMRTSIVTLGEVWISTRSGSRSRCWSKGTTFDARGACAALRERQYLRRHHLDRLAVDHREEHLQVVGVRQHGIRPGPRRNQFQVRIQQRMPDPDQATAITVGTNETRREGHVSHPDRTARTNRGVEGGEDVAVSVLRYVTSREGSRCSPAFHSTGSAAHPGSGAWRSLRPRRPASRTLVRSRRRGSSGPQPRSLGR